MSEKARFFFASIIAVAAVAGCAQSAVVPEDDDAEDVGSVEQALPTSGYYRVYFSDSTYTNAVGWENYDCDPDYRYLEGEKSRYWKQDRYDCPEFDNPLLPSCELCNTYTTSQGQTFTSCTAATCPATSW